MALARSRRLLVFHAVGLDVADARGRSRRARPSGAPPPPGSSWRLGAGAGRCARSARWPSERRRRRRSPAASPRRTSPPIRAERGQAESLPRPGQGVGDRRAQAVEVADEAGDQLARRGGVGSRPSRRPKRRLIERRLQVGDHPMADDKPSAPTARRWRCPWPGRRPSAARAMGSSISSRRSTKMSLMIGLISWVKAAVVRATTAMQVERRHEYARAVGVRGRAAAGRPAALRALVAAQGRRTRPTGRSWNRSAADTLPSTPSAVEPPGQ